MRKVWGESCRGHDAPEHDELEVERDEEELGHRDEAQDQIEELLWLR